MITILIFAILVIVKTRSDFKGGFFDFLWAIFFGSVIGGALGLMVAIILPMSTYENHYTYQIQTLQDNNSVSGRFYLGSGQIEGNFKYALYYKEDGYFKLMQIDYDAAKIKYTNSTPEVNVTELTPTENAIINYFAIDTDVYEKTYIINIPEGTIKNNYNLDAQ